MRERESWWLDGVVRRVKLKINRDEMEGVGENYCEISQLVVKPADFIAFYSAFSKLS